MDDTLDSKLRQRFAQVDSLAADESFVMQLRQQRGRHVRRSALLRRLFVGVLCVTAMAAVRLLLPWVIAVFHETGSLMTRILQGHHSLDSLVWLLAIGGASVLGVWAWSQVADRN